MNKPIYRYLADKKWRSYQRLIIVQRLTQMSIVPDVLPHFEPTADVKMAFRRRNVQPGEFIDSRVSEVPPRLKVQVFDKGERLVTVAVVDPDVPNVENDSFASRCHYLAANIPLSPTDDISTALEGNRDPISPSVAPTVCTKGLSISPIISFVLQQQPGQTFDAAELKEIYSVTDSA